MIICDCCNSSTLVRSIIVRIYNVDGSSVNLDSTIDVCEKCIELVSIMTLIIGMKSQCKQLNMQTEADGWREAAAEHLANEQNYRKKLIEIKDKLIQEGIINNIDEPDDELIMKLPQLIKKRNKSKLMEDYYNNTQI